MTQSASLFQQAMGEEFGRLDAALQRFHRLQGEHELEGRVQTGAPRTLLARLLALALGTPRTAAEGEFHIEAAVPLIGVVASYRGYLLLPKEKA
ncbi:DUF4166 domain-containing protein [Comamonas testosteroni]|uniref:DUF4166 domain-containing protein n=1 Tax=Comamonas testosteroni TaxID=285 RepID=UPI002DB9EE39|nr:DUF4166 domain-containing protein [Comamonas testosteroni]MEB5965304.1 DUF4166 domain-containing protein [Comamonas testosteroni]